jgi:hypothetical protein
MTLILGRKDVERLLTMEMTLETVEATFEEHGQGTTMVPDRGGCFGWHGDRVVLEWVKKRARWYGSAQRRKEAEDETEMVAADGECRLLDGPGPGIGAIAGNDSHRRVRYGEG